MTEKRRKHVPERSCIVCQTKRPKRELIRVVRTPEGEVVIDPKGKRSGRGAYLCPTRLCWDSAQLQRRLGQALKCQVDVKDVEQLRAAVASNLIDETASLSHQVN